MLTQTWPYGTRKDVMVVSVDSVFLMCLEKITNEGFLLIDKYEGIKVNDVGQIEFTQGGPTGGYWKFFKSGF